MKVITPECKARVSQRVLHAHDRYRCCWRDRFTFSAQWLLLTAVLRGATSPYRGDQSTRSASGAPPSVSGSGAGCSIPSCCQRALREASVGGASKRCTRTAPSTVAKQKADESGLHGVCEWAYWSKKGTTVCRKRSEGVKGSKLRLTGGSEHSADSCHTVHEAKCSSSLASSVPSAAALTYHWECVIREP